MNAISNHAWIVLFVLGLGIAYYAYDNLVVIPSLDPADLERDWTMLTKTHK